MEPSAAERLSRIARMLRDQPLETRQIVFNLDPTLAVDTPEWRALEGAVQRDLDLLEQLEAAFEVRAGPPRQYLIRSHVPRLHPLETLALHAAARLVYHRSPGHSAYVRRGLSQLARLLPDSVQPVVERSVADAGERRSREDLVLERAAEAWLEGHPLHFEYRADGGSDEWRRAELEIYLLEVHPVNLGLYAVGREVGGQHALRSFKLAHIRNPAVMRGRRYTVPDTFEPRRFLQHLWEDVGSPENAGVSVTLRFAPEVAARILEGGYANMGQPLIHKDSSVEVDVQAGVDASGLPLELMPWILGWGPRVEVLGPPEVRDHWLSELRAALRKSGGEH